MTDRGIEGPTAETTTPGLDHERIDRTLARLADRRAGKLAPHHRRTVDRAVAATTDLDRAAAFADADGRAGLERAVRAAERGGASETARRGRRALAAFDRFRRAARSAGGLDG